MHESILECVLIVLQYLLIEDVVDVGRQVRSKVSRDQHSALLVKDVDS